MAGSGTILLLIAASVTSQASLENMYAVLDFENELSFFKDCMVQVVLNDVPKKKDHEVRYHIQPLPFPIILTRYQYKKSKDRDTF
ncbi:unnamed protein product [Orchesella dallaii]|uniref:Uncharacterized protein n=1 Tax=Orchesella dallaii TaxID=48710 RepID=A0ABP1S0X7_9HEXA